MRRTVLVGPAPAAQRRPERTTSEPAAPRAPDARPALPPASYLGRRGQRLRPSYTVSQHERAGRVCCQRDRLYRWARTWDEATSGYAILHPQGSPKSHKNARGRSTSRGPQCKRRSYGQEE